MLQPNVGQPFYFLAPQYRRSGDALLASLGNEIGSDPIKACPVLFLYSHSLELYLKTLLRMKGITTKILRSPAYRHNLEKLYLECQKQGFSLPQNDRPEFERLLTFLKQGHDNYGYRYLESLQISASPQWVRLELEKVHELVRDEASRVEQAFSANRENLPSHMVVDITIGSAGLLTPGHVRER